LVKTPGKEGDEKKRGRRPWSSTIARHMRQMVRDWAMVEHGSRRRMSRSTS
jgi:hypothetical protein